MYRNFAVVIVYYMYDCVICDQKEDNIYMFKSAMFFSFNYFLFFMLHSAGDKMSPPLTWNGWRQA